MGDSACLMNGFSYASSPIPYESKQGNPMHALGESISFGRFMTESLSWEKWSTFSHKKYVEEAERYSQPGSVAQKKAFFEAHYKRIAAQKVAALLEQEIASKTEAEAVVDNNTCEEQRVILNSHSEVDEKKEEIKIVKEVEDAVNTEKEASRESPVRSNSVNQIDNLENQDTVSLSDSNGNQKLDRPLLKQKSVASEDIPSVESQKENSVTQSIRKSRVDTMGEKRSSSKSLRALMNLVPTKEPDKEPISATKKTESLGLAHSSSSIPKDCSTPIKTPVMASTKGATPLSENTRMRTQVDSSAQGGKKTGPKWHIFSAVCSKSLTAYRNKLQSPTSTTPLVLRTEERAAKREQKLEEKFDGSEVQKIKLQKTLKEKAGNEFRKLGWGFCFKARPLPDSYKERETPKNQMKKNPASQTHSTVLGRSKSNKIQGTVPPMQNPPPTCLGKNSAASMNMSKKNAVKQSKLSTNSLHERITHENASPNIQQ